MVHPKIKWTILYYANGNNELEPEMRNIMNEVDCLDAPNDVKIVLEIGRENYELVKIVRSYIQPPDPHETWEGVRRYVLQKNGLALQEDLGKTNMANPGTLQEFLHWGMRNFPAERYMLVLGGHGYQFVGTMTDYSQPIPYIMGIPGLVNAVNTACEVTGEKIDLLVMDTCYFNFIEAIYELGANPNHAVKTMMTYIGTGPLSGLSVGDIARRTERLAHLDDTRTFITEFISKLGENLITVEINFEQLKHIKELFNYLALEYCYWHPEGVNFHQLLNPNTTDPWCNKLIEIRSQLLRLVISSTNRNQGMSIINIVSRCTKDLESIQRYSLLRFAKNNYWTHLISDVSRDKLDEVLKKIAPISPVMLTPGEVLRYIVIMNPCITPEHSQHILSELARYKNWNITC